MVRRHIAIIGESQSARIVRVLLELKRDVEQQLFVELITDNLHPDGQAPFSPTWNG
jgi:hypothetical protein